MFDDVALAKFAQSLVARGRVGDIDRTVTRATLPRGRTDGDLHAAAIAQHDMLEALSSRFGAELAVVMASLERVERENAVMRGQIGQLIEYDKARRAEFQRALQDTKDMAEACVERFMHTLRQGGPVKA